VSTDEDSTHSYKQKHMSTFGSFTAVAGEGRRQNAKIEMIIFLFLSTVSSEQHISLFQADAADKVQLGFVNQGQQHRADFSKMVVDWEPKSMVTDASLLGNLEDQVVEVKEGEEGAWQKVDTSPNQRAGMYRVRVTMARPCRPHWVRILVPKADGSQEVYQHPDPLPAATREQLTSYQRKFVPSQPENLQAHALSSSSASISWHAAPCAEVYEVYVGDRRETTNSTSLLVDNLQPCSNFDISVSAVLGGQRSEEAVGYLSTPPSEDAMSVIDVQVNDGASSVMVLWTPPSSLTCVSSYAITVCPKEAKCQDPVVQEAEGETVMFFARGLAPCSNYTLHIVPQFEDFTFKPISAKASTHLGDCQEEDLLEDGVDDVSSTTPQTTVNIQQRQDFQTKRKSSTSSPVLFLSKPIASLSIILLFSFSEYI